MSFNKVKVFNLQKNRPKVLLLGNGLSRPLDWRAFIEAVSQDDVSEYYVDKEPQVPNLILASVVTDAVKDTDRKNKYVDSIKKAEAEIRENPSELLKELLSVEFDAILTTNYTYEIENNIDNKYCNSSNRTKCTKYAKSTKAKYDEKYLIHTFNRVSDETITQDIWHIHGEYRRKNSLILTHDEYARLIAKIIEYNNGIGNKFNDDPENISFDSWMDYFIMGDVYILGQGFDFSEFDLWWLLLRRKREKANTGKIVYYEPEYRNKYKLLALKALGVNTVSFGQAIDETKDKNNQFREFYIKAIEDIKGKVKTN